MRPKILTALAFVAAIACLCIAPVLASPPAEAELPTLQTLTIVSGPAVLTGATDVLPPDAAFVAEEFPGATAKSDRIGLVIGVKSEEPAGTVLATAILKSDCPNNSQFEANLPDAVAEADREQFRAALVAWTRFRHDAPKAPVLTVNDRGSDPTRRYGLPRFDVQLNLRQLSSR